MNDLGLLYAVKLQSERRASLIADMAIASMKSENSRYIESVDSLKRQETRVMSQTYW